MRITEPDFRSRLKYFLPVWLVPVILIISAIQEQEYGKENAWLGGSVPIVLAVVLNLPFLYGWISRKIPVKEMLLFWWLGPFALWVVLVQIKLAVFG